MSEDKNNETKKPASEGKEMQALKKAKKGMIGVVIGLVVLAIAGALFAGYWMVYQQTSDSAVRTWIINTFPLPVAYVDGSSVSFEQFENNIEATKHFFSQQEELGLGLVEQPSDEQLREDELERLIELELLAVIAEEMDVAVTDEDVDEYFDNTIIPQAPGGLEEVEETLTSLYNWTPEEFKQNVLREVVLGTRVGEALLQDEGQDETDLFQSAMDLYNEIQGSDKPFSEFATEHSDDPGSAANGGSLGFFARGVMVPEFEEAAFGSEIGTITEPVRTQFGYHLIHVTNKDEEADTVEAEHILLSAPTVEDLVQEKKETASITRLLPE